MKDIYVNDECSHLIQECYLAKISILTGIEHLKKAQLFQGNTDGFFYSSFFSLSIGIERFLKITLISAYLYENKHEKPTEKFLKKISHNIEQAFRKCSLIADQYNIQSDPLDEGTLAFEIINFFTEYASKTRYQNLNNLTQAEVTDKHPIHNWFNLSIKYFNNKEGLNRVRNNLEKELKKFDLRRLESFTYFINFNDNSANILTFGELIEYSYIVEKTKAYIIYDLLLLLKPFFRLLDHISMLNNNGPEADLNCALQLPYFGEMFSFFYTDLNTIKRRKVWTDKNHIL